jgi:hypothetical protein
MLFPAGVLAEGDAATRLPLARQLEVVQHRIEAVGRLVDIFDNHNRVARVQFVGRADESAIRQRHPP